MRSFLFVALLMTACSPIYMPNTRNVPLFRGAGEVQGSVYVANGVDVQGAFAFSNNLAVIGNYSLLNQKQTDYTRKNKYGELGLGYFKNNRSSRWELFVGYGVGEGTSKANYYFYASDFGIKDIIATGKFNRIFIQPTIATNNKKFNLAFTPRFSLVDFTEFTSSGPPSSTLGAVTKKPDEKAYLFIEPAATVKFPLAGNLVGVFQLGVNTPTNSDVYFDYSPFQTSIGIQLHVGGKLRTRVY